MGDQCCSPINTLVDGVYIIRSSISYCCQHSRGESVIEEALDHTSIVDQSISFTNSRLYRARNITTIYTPWFLKQIVYMHTCFYSFIVPSSIIYRKETSINQNQASTNNQQSIVNNTTTRQPTNKEENILRLQCKGLCSRGVLVVVEKAFNLIWTE